MRAAVACLLLVSGCGCSNTGPSGTMPADARAGGGAPEIDAMKGPRVILLPAAGGEAPVDVAIADTPAERERGLMYVQNLPPDAGMLFIFETDEVQTFWMKNTLIRLDMIFIRSDLTVAGLVANAEPLTLTGRTIDKPSRYVLEVNGGWAAAHGVAEGAHVRFEGFTP